MAGGVLWAEDNMADQILIHAALEEMAAAPVVHFARDGLHLLDLLQAQRPDHVVLDLKMPRLGGIETLRRIRANPAWRDLPVSIFSAGDQPEETAACQALGARVVVQKPVDFRLFTEAVRRLVQTR
ncbi:MAG: response regulator [Halobacteriales archaeon]|nr:response regulator [Halobacteriales archaeon]